MFGEIAAIDRKPRSASIEALETCTIASLSSDQFEALLLREPSVAMATLREIAADVRRLSERVFEFSTMAVRNRIHAELLRLAGQGQFCQPDCLSSATRAGLPGHRPRWPIHR
jgi:CRP-like cAMP-binding protein